MRTSDQRGAITESAIAAVAIQLGLGVSTPLSEGFATTWSSTTAVDCSESNANGLARDFELDRLDFAPSGAV